jgi:protein tyrosine/serine phosphatase
MAATTSSLPPGNMPGNLYCVTEGIYRGARPDIQEKMDYLVKSLHVKTIIDLQGGDPDTPLIGKLVPYFEKGEKPEDIAAERTMAAVAGVTGDNFLSKPLNSLEKVTTGENQTILEILSIMNDQNRQPVYVHCAHGADRTGVVVALYRVIYQHWDIWKAYDEMYENGHNWFHILFTNAMDRDFFKEAADAVRAGKKL